MRHPLSRRAFLVPSAAAPVPLPTTSAAAHLANRATFGCKLADVARINAMGAEAWIDEQLEPDSIDDNALENALGTLIARTATNAADVRMMARAIFSKRQLAWRMVYFLNNHFATYRPKTQPISETNEDDTFRRLCFGAFRDVLRASAQSPAMIDFLDSQTNVASSPNENYARELMELHTLGVDGGYTQRDVEELARVLTGWTFVAGGQFTFTAARHDFGAKTVLGVSIPATSPTIGAEGVKEGERMLDVLLKHPSTGRFLASKLLKWFVTPEPTTAQIDAVAAVYRATNGDIKRMVRATLNEGWMAQAPLKLKRPYHMVVSSLRNTSAIVVNLQGAVGTSAQLGQSLFAWETPDGFPDIMEYWAGNNTPRWAFLTGLANSTSTTAFRVSMAPYMAGTPDAALDMMNVELFGGEMASATREQLRAFLLGATFNEARVRETLGLALCSHEFQWY
jgi:uncharacterized protein (DUF1800 family)